MTEPTPRPTIRVRVCADCGNDAAWDIVEGELACGRCRSTDYRFAMHPTLPGPWWAWLVGVALALGLVLSAAVVGMSTLRQPTREECRR